jgi:PLP dependent protein
MGMATFTQDTQQIRDEFTFLAQIYQELQPIQPAFNTLSMGMSGDFPIALECGSNLVRVGTAIFGTRTT